MAIIHIQVTKQQQKKTQGVLHNVILHPDFQGFFVKLRLIINFD